MNAKRGWVFWGALFLAAKTAMAQQPAAPPAPLAAVLTRIHEHATGDAWKQNAFRDERIEAWLEQLVGAISKAADKPNLKVPVRMADVQALDVADGGVAKNVLIVGKNVNLPYARLTNSIVLSDGDVYLNRVDGCVIIARGVAQLHQPRNCVIAAGAYAKIVSFDGSPGPGAMGSVIVSRGWTNVQTAYGSFVAGLKGVEIERAQNARIINGAEAAPAPQPAGFRGGRGGVSTEPLKIPNLPLEDLPEIPLLAALAIQGLVRPDGVLVSGRGSIGPEFNPPPPSGVVVRHGGRRYVALLGQPIVDQASQPVESLRGWQVNFADDRVAILCNGTTVVPVRLPGNP